mgnify:CR=1 FL=1
MSTLKIVSGSIRYINNNEANNKSLIPSDEHPFDHLVLVAQLQRPWFIPLKSHYIKKLGIPGTVLHILFWDRPFLSGLINRWLRAGQQLLSCFCTVCSIFQWLMSKHLCRWGIYTIHFLTKILWSVLSAAKDIWYEKYLIERSLQLLEVVIHLSVTDCIFHNI